MTDRILSNDHISRFENMWRGKQVAPGNIGNHLFMVCASHHLLSARVKELEEERCGLLDYIQQLEGATQT